MKVGDTRHISFATAIVVTLSICSGCASIPKKGNDRVLAVVDPLAFIVLPEPIVTRGDVEPSTLRVTAETRLRPVLEAIDENFKDFDQNADATTLLQTRLVVHFKASNATTGGSKIQITKPFAYGIDVRSGYGMKGSAVAYGLDGVTREAAFTFGAAVRRNGFSYQLSDENLTVAFGTTEQTKWGNLDLRWKLLEKLTPQLEAAGPKIDYILSAATFEPQFFSDWDALSGGLGVEPERLVFQPQQVTWRQLFVGQEALCVPATFTGFAWLSDNLAPMSVIHRRPDTESDGRFHVAFQSRTDMAELAGDLQARLNRVPYWQGAARIQFQEVQIHSDNGGLIVQLRVTGNIQGQIFLTTTPSYDWITNTLRFENAGWTPDTEQALQTAPWIDSADLLKWVLAICVFQIHDDPFAILLKLRHTLSLSEDPTFNLTGRLDRLRVLAIKTGRETYTEKPKLMIRMVADGDVELGESSACKRTY
jgi:hypothetical protein